MGVATPLVLLLIEDPSAETTQAAPGMIPPRLVIQAVSVYALTFFTPLACPKNIQPCTRPKPLPPDSNLAAQFRSPAGARASKTLGNAPNGGTHHGKPPLTRDRPRTRYFFMQPRCHPVLVSGLLIPISDIADVDTNKNQLFSRTLVSLGRCDLPPRLALLRRRLQIVHPDQRHAFEDHFGPEFWQVRCPPESQPVSATFRR